MVAIKLYVKGRREKARNVKTRHYSTCQSIYPISDLFLMLVSNTIISLETNKRRFEGENEGDCDSVSQEDTVRGWPSTESAEGQCQAHYNNGSNKACTVKSICLLDAEASLPT